jgi:RNA polymerase sigma factor (TIGR02999 family)
MRRILIENARRKQSQRRGKNHQRIDLDNADLFVESPSEDLIALNEALTKFAADDPERADLIRLCYFGGLTIEQAAKILKISRATAYRYWSYARAWLYNEIKKG